MPRLTHKLPSYRHYLGVWNSPQSRAEYDRLVGEWLASGRGSSQVDDRPRPGASDPSISEVLLAFWEHAQTHYRDLDGYVTQEVKNIRDSIRPVRRLYGATPARSFGPLALRVVRDDMVKSGLARTTVNSRINRIRRVFTWAASVELVPASVVQALRTIDGLREGRTEAHEAEPIRPVPIEHVEAVLPALPRPIATMVRIQLLTGCRAGEVMAMRGCDIVATDPTWEYRPARHKTQWRGKSRVIPLGPKAQEIVKQFLNPELLSFLFSPADVVVALHARRGAARKSKRTPSEVSKRCAAGPGHKHAPRYKRGSYLQAVVRACRTVGVAEWAPLQLRHTAATLIRARYGLETAQVVLGHAKADTTEIYAERDLSKARAVMVEIG
jgi:integrase